MKRFVFAFLFWIINPFSLIFAQSVVQLPEYQQFGMSTTVMVPDGGSIQTGGITRSYSGGTSSGTPILPFGNRSYGSSGSIGSVQTSVQVIDLHEMDEAILNSPSTFRVHRAGQPLIPEDRFQQKHSTVTHSPKAQTSTHDQLKSRISVQKKTKSKTNQAKKKKRSEELRKPLEL